jgi:membrane-bound metal-dependent hydrolase YbcI (DUF457 family)
VLPPGHLAGGYLAALAAIKLGHPSLDPLQINQLLFLGSIAGLAPDLDHIITFAQARTLKLPEDRRNHRNLFTHTPFFWLVISTAVYLLTKQTAFGPYTALTVLVGSWSHFFLDTCIYGVSWLWPVSSRKFAFFDKEMRPGLTEPNLVRYWWKFFWWYAKRICFYLEILIVIIALFIFISR